jgi:hypothetical protein
MPHEFDKSAARALEWGRLVSDRLLTPSGELAFPCDLSDLEIEEGTRLHIAQIVTYLEANQGVLSRFSSYVCGDWARTLVALSNGKELYTLTARDVRRAVLSALLTPLRQTVGSCFATAPAIIVQREQPWQLIEDLFELLTRGRLSRVRGGEERLVPMSPSYGASLHHHPLLKVWEFTLASFAEANLELCSWNLLAALGFTGRAESGVGKAIADCIADAMGDIEETMRRHGEEAEGGGSVYDGDVVVERGEEVFEAFVGVAIVCEVTRYFDPL